MQVTQSTSPELQTRDVRIRAFIRLVRRAHGCLRLRLVDILTIEPALLGPLRASHANALRGDATSELLLLLANDLVRIGRCLAALLLLLLRLLSLGESGPRHEGDHDKRGSSEKN